MEARAANLQMVEQVVEGAAHPRLHGLHQDLVERQMLSGPMVTLQHIAVAKVRDLFQPFPIVLLSIHLSLQ